MNRPAKIGCGLSAGLVLALAGLIAFGVYQFQRDRGATLALRKAESALGQRDFDAAIALFDGVLQSHLSPSKAAAAYYGRGCAKSGKFKYEDAIHDFSEALRLDSTKVNAYWGRGYAYQEKDELDKALVDYSEVLQRNPNLGQVYFNRGVIYRQRKELALAAPDFSEAIRCEPRDTYAYIERGSALMELGDLDGALASLDASISIKPLADAYKVRATIHRRRGDEERARDDERKMAQFALPPLAPVPLAPMFGGTAPGADLLGRARIAAMAGRYDEAIDLCNRALGMSLSASLASGAFVTRGGAYAGKDDWDRALHDYEEAIKIEPKNADAWVNRGNAYAHKNQRDKSTSDYNEAIRLNPNLAEAYCNRALDYLTAKRTDKALADLAEAIRVNPKLAEAYRFRAMVLLGLKRTDEALADAQTLVTLKPESGEACLVRARIYLGRREYTKAREDFERVLQLGHEPLSVPLNAVAWLYATCPDKAVRDGKRAVELATKGCEVTKWKDARIVDTLAAAFAEAGNFSEAVKWQAYALNSSEDREDVRSRMKERLQLFQQHQAYREEAE